MGRHTKVISVILKAGHFQKRCPKKIVTQGVILVSFMIKGCIQALILKIFSNKVVTLGAISNLLRGEGVFLLEH